MSPSLVALIICDQVIDDRLTNKKSAIGLFNAVLVQRFPTAIAQMVALAAVTEIQGEAPLTMRLIRDADNAVLVTAGQTVRANSPLVTVDIVFGLQGVQIAEPGQYAVELLCGEELLGRRRFQVMQRPEKGS